MTTTRSLLAAACLALASATAYAVDPLDADTLAELCDTGDATPASEAETACTLYISGFLDGAVATDERVTRNVADEIGRDESLSERAIRTRIIRRLEVQGPTGYAEFCVGQPVPVADVVARVVDELRERDSLAGVEAREVVYGALRRHYPCR